MGRVAHTLSCAFVKGKGVVRADFLFNIWGGGMVTADLLFSTLC